MHSGFEILHSQQHEQKKSSVRAENSRASFSQTHINLEQIHYDLPTTTQQLLFLDYHHHQYTASLPANFELGLSAADVLRQDEDDVIPEEARHTNNYSLGMLHYWHHQQQPFWEPLPKVSNENSEILEHSEINHHKEAARNSCLEESKSKTPMFGELEAIYKRISPLEKSTNQTCTNYQIVPGFYHHGSSDHSTCKEIEESELLKHSRKKRKKKGNEKLIKFFERLVKQVMDHQYNLHKKFGEVVEKLDEKQKEREESWRKQELACFQQGFAVRAREKALAASREASIVSYLEKITGERINFPPFDLNTDHASR